MELNKLIDHTKLGPTVTQTEIDQLIDEAIKYQFKAVCVSPVWVKYAKEKVEGSDVLVCTVVGFPHGTQLTKVKAFETKEAIKDGADEIDMVIHVADVLEKNRSAILKDVKAVVKAAAGRTVKVIVETAFLDKKQIEYVTKIVLAAKADFIKTSTGYASRGANLDDIKIMKKVAGDQLLIKASGGVKTYEDAIEMIEAGASRIGTSRGVSLINKEKSNVNTTYWIKR